METAPASHNDRLDNTKARWFALGLMAAIAVVHVWIISAGSFTSWPTRTAYYSLLADGFLKGQVSLPIEPDPRLLASPDPYDPRYNSKLRLQDGALYHGKYYIYWGPLPALLLVPLRLLPHGFGVPIGDQYVYFAFSLGLVAVSAKVILRARRCFFRDQPWWTIGFGVVIAGLVNPIPFLLANASIYQTAIVGGQVFLLAGIHAAWRALETPRNPRRAGAGLVVAGACWAMAVGCRISLSPAVVALSCLVAWRLWADISPWRNAGRCLVCLGLPLLAGAGLFAAYNQARFGSPFEFGARYVLAGQNIRAMVAAGTFSSARYIPINLVRDLLEAPVLKRQFPFICPYGTAAWGWFGIRVHKDFIIDSVAGMLWAAPVFGLAAVPIWVKLTSWRQRPGSNARSARLDNNSSGQMPPEPAPPIKRPLSYRTAPSIAEAGLTVGTGQRSCLLWWLIATLLLAAVIGILPSLTVAASTMRYLADATPSLAILASLGIWMYQPATPRQRASRVRTLILLTAYSALMGILLGVAGHYGRFITDHVAGRH